MTNWTLIEGDCRTVLAAMKPGSVHTVVTSPPYFGLRDYGHKGQIGLEPTPDEFVAALVGVFRGVRRVLRDDGTVWLNLGDSYASTTKGSGGTAVSEGMLNRKSATSAAKSLARRAMDEPRRFVIRDDAPLFNTASELAA